MSDPSNPLSDFLDTLAKGDSTRVPLFRRLYEELHVLAARHLQKERNNHTLQPTALVHEALLRLEDSGGVEYQDRTHFFAAAAQAMRRILVESARARIALKRGGDRQRVTLNEELLSTDEEEVDVLALDEALNRLAQLSERQARVVELRFFAGLKEQEVAAAIGVSERTVRNDWAVARAWLRRELEDQESE